MEIAALTVAAFALVPSNDATSAAPGTALPDQFSASDQLFVGPRPVQVRVTPSAGLALPKATRSTVAEKDGRQDRPRPDEPGRCDHAGNGRPCRRRGIGTHSLPCPDLLPAVHRHRSGRHTPATVEDSAALRHPDDRSLRCLGDTGTSSAATGPTVLGRWVGASATLLASGHDRVDLRLRHRRRRLGRLRPGQPAQRRPGRTASSSSRPAGPTTRSTCSSTCRPP